MHVEALSHSLLPLPFYRMSQAKPLWKVSVCTKGGNVLPCEEYLAGKINDVETEMYDTQGENDQRFVLLLERQADMGDAYAIILLDGVICDHFLIASEHQSQVSQGYRESASQVYTYEWSRRLGDRHHPEHFRVESLSYRKSRREEDLTGFITVRFYRLDSGLYRQLKTDGNFLPRRPSKRRHNKPLMSCYAILSLGPIRTKPSLQKPRLPLKALQQELPVPFSQILIRYNDEIRKHPSIYAAALTIDTESEAKAFC
ncbi:hypothetical protein JB92DRAFT_1411097 [Gautieria morchelliformis]|nr:hypothetical protein JB92DRAFT_1411097 [Gautieria morchelliformis]